MFSGGKGKTGFIFSFMLGIGLVRARANLFFSNPLVCLTYVAMFLICMNEVNNAHNLQKHWL